ncbi:MAG: DUF2325 domain-containing protein [Pelosinus sp.]|nr:DUF2325 domain-containing protein [Pelosinus sp.]
MDILIVGADNLGSIEKNLKLMDIAKIVHITGRNTADRKCCSLSPAIKLVLILTDFVNHNTAKVYKKQAKLSGIPLICAKRSWSSIEKKLCAAGLGI